MAVRLIDTGSGNGGGASFASTGSPSNPANSGHDFTTGSAGSSEGFGFKYPHKNGPGAGGGRLKMGGGGTVSPHAGIGQSADYVNSLPGAGRNNLAEGMNHNSLSDHFSNGADEAHDESAGGYSGSNTEVPSPPSPASPPGYGTPTATESAPSKVIRLGANDIEHVGE